MLTEKEAILNHRDLLNMLDSLLREEAPWWDHFYEDRRKNIPFFVPSPDENLVHYFEQSWIQPGSVLELGCGPGRNAIYMSSKGCHVDGVDISSEALVWAKERAADTQVSERIRFIHANLFDVKLEPESYDLVYDSGCFHHVPPHRRMDYVELVTSVLKPSGHFGLTCFAYGDQCTAELSDWEVYRQKSLRGGLAFTEEKLRAIFSPFDVVQIRKMIPYEQPSPRFGVPFLWTALFQKRPL